MPRPLDGIRVLDFTRYQQGPYATTMLADMGAEVLKLEAPRGGDYGRRLLMGPDGFSGFFEALNRGKKSLCIDLRVPEGRDLALSLGADCDVIVENFRVGTMDRWGLGYEAFESGNERVIYASATGWGPAGELSESPSFDQTAQAYSGFAQHSGGGPGAVPIIPYPGLADQVGAMNLAYGIMSGLFVRERLGIGQKVEVSLFGAMLALQGPELQYALHYGSERDRERRAAPTIGEFQCADGKWIMVAALDQKFWPRLCEAIHAPQLVEDERFARGLFRFEHREVLEPILEEFFRARDSEEWLARLAKFDVPCAPVLDYVGLRHNRQARASGYIVDRDHPKFGSEPVIGTHVQLNKTPSEVGPAAPELGADTFAELAAHGLSREAIEDLVARGVIAGARD
jgi:crotonobetainyl-CoA:carnitine CoA-transferase CaiB-like acyl-CoA transferase